MAKLIDFETGADLERRLVTDLVNEEQDFATGIINSIHDGICAYDIQCRYTLWNPAIAKMTGMSAKAVLGRCAFDVFPFLKSSELGPLFHSALLGISRNSREVRFTIPETGREGFCQSSHSPLYDDVGKIVGGLGIVRDVTDRVQTLDEIRKLNRGLEKTIQFVSDSGNLITARGNLYSTVRKMLDLAMRHFDGWAIAQLKTESGRLTTLIEHEDLSQRELARKLMRGFLQMTGRGPLHVMRTRVTRWVPRIDDAWLEEYRPKPDLYAILKALQLKSFICVPLIAGHEVLGAINMASSKRNYDREDVTVAEDLGHRLALIFETARLRRELAQRKRNPQ